MEYLFAIEVIGKNLCKYLDCKSMLNVKEVSTTLYESMEKQKVAWIRTVQNRFTVRTGKVELPESWKQVYKLPSENLKKVGLALDPNNRITDWRIQSFENNFPLLHFVAGFGDMELYRFLANNGNPINKDGPLGYTPLHSAALNGKLEVVQFILDRTQDKNPAAARFGTTPLHCAAKYGHEEVFKAIFNEIEDKNPVNCWGDTPLHYAALHGHLGLCQFIIDRVDEKNPRSNNGTTPLELAHRKGFSEIVKLFK